MDIYEVKDNDTVNVRCLIHVIENGDSLYSISRRYDVKILDIMRLNPYINVYNLQIGDEICIPTCDTNGYGEFDKGMYK